MEKIQNKYIFMFLIIFKQKKGNKKWGRKQEKHNRAYEAEQVEKCGRTE